MIDDKETKEDPTFSVMPSLLCPTLPFTPFLLTSLIKDGGKSHFIIDGMDGETVEVLDNGSFVQIFKWIAHKASNEEIKKFLGEGDK